MRLFIHIPKNGGMTLRHGLKGRILLASPKRHVNPEYTMQVSDTMREYGEHHGFEHARLRDVRRRWRSTAFTIARNPWARVVSRYTFAQIAGDKSGKKSFRDFLSERHIYGGIKYFWHRAIRGWYPQVDYISDGEFTCDVLRFGTTDVQKYFGLKKPLKIRNISNVNRLDYREFYGPEEYDIVADWYRKDIEFFGFTFDGHATANIWKPS